MGGERHGKGRPGNIKTKSSEKENNTEFVSLFTRKQSNAHPNKTQTNYKMIKEQTASGYTN